MDAKEFTKFINQLEEKPGGTIRIFGEWFGRPYDNYHKISVCTYQDNILKMSFDTGETIKLWEPSHIVFNANELTIKGSTCVEFFRYDYGKPRTNKNVIVDRYTNDVVSNLSIESGQIYQRTMKKGYPAVELL